MIPCPEPDFMWNHAPMLNSGIQKDTKSTTHTILQLAKLQQEKVYGHLTSDHNINISRKKRIKQDILQEFISNSNRVSPNKQQNNPTQTLQMVFEENGEENNSSQVRASIKVSQSTEKSEELQGQFSSKKSLVQSSIPLTRDSAHQNNTTSEQQNLDAISSQQLEGVHQQELHIPEEHSYQAKDASTQEIYIAGIQDGYDGGFLNTTELQFLITLDDVEKIEELHPNELERIPFVQAVPSSLDKNTRTPYQQLIHYILPFLFLIGTIYVLFFGSV